METPAILRFKNKSNQGGSQYYFDTKTSEVKGRKTITVETTTKIEQAKRFPSFGQAGLACQKPEMNMQFEAVVLHEALLDEIKSLRLIIELSGQN